MARCEEKRLTAESEILLYLCHANQVIDMPHVQMRPRRGWRLRRRTAGTLARYGRPARVSVRVDAQSVEQVLRFDLSCGGKAADFVETVD